MSKVGEISLVLVRSIPEPRMKFVLWSLCHSLWGRGQLQLHFLKNISLRETFSIIRIFFEIFDETLRNYFAIFNIRLWRSVGGFSIRCSGLCGKIFGVSWEWSLSKIPKFWSENILYFTMNVGIRSPEVFVELSYQRSWN